MIARLTGLIGQQSDGSIIIDVGGVGYLVFCSKRTLNILISQGDVVSVYVETHVREDHIHLYGFADQLEQEWFRLLTTVQGVGAKVALAILSVSEPAVLAQTVGAADKAAISQAPGVGPKLATRIISELKDKLANKNLGNFILSTNDGSKVDNASEINTNTATADAVSALVNLGYGRTEAFSAVAQASQRHGDKATVETLVKDGLAGLSNLETGSPN